jgi:gliding motility-associated-like protein
MGGHRITNAVLGVFDPATAGAGSHTITCISNTYCPDTASVNITVSLNTGYSISGSDSLCEGADINLQSTSGGGATILWNGPNGFSSAVNNNTIAQSSFTNSGLYILTVTYPNCPSWIDTLPITVVPYANPSILPAGPFCNDELSQTLSAFPIGGIWAGTGITNTVNGTFDPAIAGNGNHTIWYLISGICPDTASIQINVANSVPLSAIVFPNVFTPNSDGQNDLYAPQVPSGGHYDLVIFDRWGVQVFQADPDIGWNGMIGGSFANEGIYYWICEITSDCSSTPLVEKGFLQLFKP